jgi:hypothetical protein
MLLPAGGNDYRSGPELSFFFPIGKTGGEIPHETGNIGQG